QLGTRALCLGQEFEARSRLTEALRIRESLGDTRGAAVTRHNLGFLPGGGPPSRPAAALATAAPVVGGLSLLALLALLLAGALVLGGLVLVGARTVGGGGGGAGADLSGLMVTPARHDFGERPALDPSPPRTVTISNGTDGAVKLDAVALVGSAEAFRIENDTCRGTTLDQGGACTLAVLFNAPQAGTFDARLVVRSGGRDGPSTALAGVGTAGPGPNGTVPPTTVPPTTIPPNGTTTTTLPVGECRIQVPAAQSVLYGSRVHLTTSPSGSPAQTLGAQGLPRGLSFVDNGNGTATVSGTMLAAPGRYAATITGAIGGRPCGSGSTVITVAKAPVKVTWAHPLLDITPGTPAMARGLVTQTAGTRGRFAEAQSSVIFTVMDASGQVVLQRTSPVDSTGEAPLQIAVGELPLGVYTARASFANDRYFFEPSSVPPLAVVVNTDVLGASVYALSDLLKDLVSA
ncbi:MAG TPA: hypothetical protein VHF24_01280, partial [Acidimicrobiales bacterium]|nr:hypothetical protein [Acidimicrobiales bacterium]